MKSKDVIIKAVTAVVAVIAVGAAVYIMVHQLGLSDELDFGAGAYYYADSPQLQDISDAAAYTTRVPTWLHIVLFLAWGWLMYRLWVWIDSRGTKKH